MILPFCLFTVRRVFLYVFSSGHLLSPDKGGEIRENCDGFFENERTK